MKNFILLVLALSVVGVIAAGCQQEANVPAEGAGAQGAIPDGGGVPGAGAGGGQTVTPQ